MSMKSGFLEWVASAGVNQNQKLTGIDGWGD